MPVIFKPSYIWDTDNVVPTNGTDLCESDTSDMLNGIMIFQRKVGNGSSIFRNLPYSLPLPWGPGLTPAEAAAQVTAPSDMQQPSGVVRVQGAVPTYPKPGTITQVDPQRATLMVTATAAAGIALTATLPAVASAYHVIVKLSVVLYSSAARTGSATPVLVTTTNLPGSPAFTLPSAGAVGTISETNIDCSQGLRSSLTNTATTIVCPATASVIWRVNCIYRTSPI